MDCLPLLASVLGNQYGVTVEIGGSEAYTDGKTIHLPALPLDSEPELITMIKGYCDHESAHIRETDFEILRKADLTPFQHNLFNILEDWRVEERLSARYPGCRENFRHLIQKLFRAQKAGDTNPAFSILNTILLTVRSWSVDAIIPRRESVAKTMERQYPGLRKALGGILGRMRGSCKDTGDCIRYALELEQAILQWYSEQTDAQQRRKKDESITKDTLDTAEVSLGALASMLNASPSDELPKGFGESLAERIKLDSPKNRRKQLRVAVTGRKRLVASSRTTQPDRTPDCRARFQTSGIHAGAEMAARHAGSTRTSFLFAVPQVGGRESQSLREERFQGIAGHGGSYPLGQQRFHDGLRPHAGECRVLCRGKSPSGYPRRKSGHYGVSRRKQGETRGNGGACSSAR